jgi:hypothetical protein
MKNYVVESHETADMKKIFGNEQNFNLIKGLLDSATVSTTASGPG